MAHYRTGDGELHNLDPLTWSNADVSAVQRILGCPLAAYVGRLQQLDVDAIQATLWVIRRRDERNLKLEDVRFTVHEFLESNITTDQDVRDLWGSLKPEYQKDFYESLDEDQQERLFDQDGKLKPEERPDPLDPPDAGDPSQT